jgi:hypothetical protein
MKPDRKYEVFDYKDNFDKLLKIICGVLFVSWLVDGLKFLP